MKTDVLGEITACYRLHYERRSKHSAARLWRALTEPDEVGVWMEHPAHIDLRVGGTWKIDFDVAEDNYLAGIIIGVEHERRLAYAWGLSVCEWTITERDDGCVYTFVQNGLSDRGEGEEGLAAGWHGFFDQLDMHLDGVAFTREEQEADWKRMHAPYLEKLNAVFVKRAPGKARPGGDPGR
ncbi:MAG: SRPBCC domain-containing protein [Actinomycetota bacterium]